MKNIHLKTNHVSTRLLLSLLLLVIFTPVVTAQSGGSYDLTWNTLDSGGGTSSGGNFTLSGTIAQIDAGSSTGGVYKVEGGFWPGGITCFVDLEDLNNFIGDWMLLGFDIPGDLNNDLIVNMVDFSILASYWMNYCPDSNWPL